MGLKLTTDGLGFRWATHCATPPLTYNIYYLYSTIYKIIKGDIIL